MRGERGLWMRLLIILLVLASCFGPLPALAQVRLTIEAIVLRDANLRLGPGVTYAIIGAAKAGQWVTVTDYTGEWYQLSTGEWIAKFLVAATAESRVVAFRLADVPAAANRAANLRGGPGITYAVVGGVYAGQALQVVGQNQAGDWLQLQSGQWIAAFLVNRVTVGLPVVVEEPTPLPPATPLPEPTPAPSSLTE